MKRICVIAVGACLALGLAARAEVVSGVSIVVNDDVITRGEIMDKVAPRLQMLYSMYPNDEQRFDEERRKVYDQQVEELVERKLILHEFTAGGYMTNVLEAFIDDQIKKNIQRDYYGDRSRLIKTLQAEGRTYEMYRRQERENFIVNYMGYQNVDAPKKILISPLKIEQFYKNHQEVFKVDDQVKVRMIVINQPPDGSPGEAKRTADEILAKINSGVPFAEMASVYTSGSKRAEGGERGWVDRSYFKSELAKVAFSLKAGQHSGVIELPEACYILMVEDVRPAHIKSLAESRDDIERTLKTREKDRLHKQWIERLKSKSFIEYY
ncbi:MAG: peptidylprolyl isomerase [Limisphaerales bacterium]